MPLYTTDLPEVHSVIRGLRQVIDEFPERLLIGEVYLPLKRLVAYYGNDLGEAHLPFNFSLLETRWHARDIAKLVDGYELRCLRVAGQIGFLAITIDLASRRASVPRKPASQPCCCLRCAVRLQSTTAMRSDCLRCRSRLSPFVTLLKRICRVLASVATARELPCSEIVVRSPASPVLNRGCRSALTGNAECRHASAG